MNYLLHHIAPFGLSLLIVIVLIPIWISICRKWNLFDEPDARKHHRHLTPSMGGIAIFAGLFISYLSFATVQDPDKLRYLIGASLILFFTGFFDDLMDVPAKNKLLLQIASALVVFFGGYRIESLGGLFGIGEIPVFIQLPLTVFFIVAFTNAFNFIDGIDGLAATLGLVMMISLGLLFASIGRIDYAMLCFCMVGALAGFLVFNISPARIFMGDTGSLIVGFITVVMSVELFHQGLSTDSRMDASVVLAIVFVPLFDISRVLLIRFLNGASPFMPDRNHLHHTILRYGFGHTASTFLIVGLAIAIIVLQRFLAGAGILVFLTSAVALALMLVNTHTLSALVRVRELLQPGWKESRRNLPS